MSLGGCQFATRIEVEKRRDLWSRPLLFDLLVRLSLDGAVSQASGANVLFGHRTLLIHDGNLLDIRVPMGGGFAITVADGVSRHFTLSANAANSRHISITSRKRFSL